MAEARRELEEAAAHYDDQRLGLGREFTAELREAVANILEYRHSKRVLTLHTRRKRMKRFKYGVVYRSTEESLTIVAVMHLSRRPSYWRERLSGP